MDASNPHHNDNTRGVASSVLTPSNHIAALDGLVNVNSLFTIAVFVGLTFTTRDQRSLENRTACDAGVDVAEKLLVFKVVSFSSFLFSSLIAQGLKMTISVLDSKDVNVDSGIKPQISLRVMTFGMPVSAAGTVVGSIFLVLSLVKVIEIRLGLLSCGSSSSVQAVATLVFMVSTGLLCYISTIVYAVLR